MYERTFWSPLQSNIPYPFVHHTSKLEISKLKKKSFIRIKVKFSVLMLTMNVINYPKI